MPALTIRVARHIHMFIQACREVARAAGSKIECRRAEDQPAASPASKGAVEEAEEASLQESGMPANGAISPLAKMVMRLTETTQEAMARFTVTFQETV